MSIEAINWALNQAPVEDSGMAAVLLGLANHANPDGSECWPSVERLAYYARMSERTVRRHLRALEDAGLIEQDADTRGRDAKTRADQRPTVYRLLMKGSTREDWETRRDRLRAERKQSNGGSQCPPVVTGGQNDRGDIHDSTGGHGDPQTVLDPPPLSPPASERGGAPEGDGQPALVDVPAPRPKRRARMTEDWRPSEELLAKAAAKAPGADVVAEARKFRDHHLASGRPMLDWDLAFLSTWMGNVRPPRGGRPYRDPQRQHHQQQQIDGTTSGPPASDGWDDYMTGGQR